MRATDGRPYGLRSKHLFTIHYSLFTLHYSLFTIHFSLLLSLVDINGLDSHRFARLSSGNNFMSLVFSPLANRHEKDRYAVQVRIDLHLKKRNRRIIISSATENKNRLQSNQSVKCKLQHKTQHGG